MTTARNVHLGFTPRIQPEGTHMCLIYDSDDQRRRIIGRFLASGITAGEQVFYFSADTSQATVREWIQDCGVNVAKAEAEGKFIWSKTKSAYFPDGKFDPSEMLDRLRAGYASATAAGRPGLRVSGEMEWAAGRVPGADKLAEYESLVNTLARTHPVTGICQYDARKFSVSTLLPILRAHPLLITNEEVVESPYHRHPEWFL